MSIRAIAVALTVVFLGLSHFVAYWHGTDVTQAKAELRIAKLDKDIADQRTAHAKAEADHLEQMRAKDRANVEAMAAIESKFHQEALNREIISNRTIADLRAGTIGLRDKFTTCQRAANSGAGQAGTSACSSDAAASIELRGEDAEFLIWIAHEADKVADQLRACQNIVRSDRADGKGLSKHTEPSAGKR